MLAVSSAHVAGDAGASDAARNPSAPVPPSCPPALLPSPERAWASGVVLALALSLAACETASSALAPAGPQAARIADLWWVTLAILGTVWVLVVAFLVYAGRRRRLPPGEDPGQAPDVDARLTRWVGGATIVTALIVIGFLVGDVTVGHALERLAGRPGAVNVTVIGHQWWWEVRYEGNDSTKEVVTANELHIPVGRPVNITGKSVDVIHSFWVPQLHGKRDLIPGYNTNLWLEADRPGVYRGQCAEFCGLQHAHMALLVVAEPEVRYEAWLEQQRDTAPAPTSPLAQRGKQVFLGTSCALCHAIRGTPAGSNNGPDLTHVASRLTLGAGTLPNNIGALSGWILDPHASKPGNNMPGNALSTADLQALVTYLGGLR